MALSALAPDAPPSPFDLRPPHPDVRHRRPADRRPRPGPAGPRGRLDLPRCRVRRAGCGRRRSRRQHEPDGLPGGLHRPLLRGPGRGHDLPAHRQLRAPLRRRPVGAAVAARADRGQRDRRRAGRRAAARPAPAGQRHPGDRGRRHAGPGTAPPGQRQPPRAARWNRPPWRPGRWTGGAAVARARAVPRWEDQDFVAEVSPGGGQRGGRGHGWAARRWTARRDRRLRAEGQHRAEPATARCSRAGPSAYRERGRRPLRRRRGRRALARAGRPGATRTDPLRWRRP